MNEQQNPQPLLPGSLVFLLTAALLIFLFEHLVSFVQSFNNLLLMLALAWLVSFTLRPLIEWISQRPLPTRLTFWRPTNARTNTTHLSYGLAALLVYLLLFVGFILIVLALLPIVVNQLERLALTMQTQAGNVPVWIQRANELVEATRVLLIERLRIDANQVSLPQPQELLNQLPIVGANMLQFGLGLAGGIAAFITQFLLIIFLSLFISLDSHQLSSTIFRVLPRRYEDEMRLFVSTIDRTFGGFLRGTLLQGLIYGFGVTLVMALLRIDSAVAVGVTSGVMMIVPVFGGIIGVALPVLAALVQGSSNVFLLFLILLGLQVILFNVVMPQVLGGALRVPTLLIMISLLFGVQVMGFWGFVFGAPAAAAIYSIALVFLERNKLRVDALDEKLAPPTS